MARSPLASNPVEPSKTLHGPRPFDTGLPAQSILPEDSSMTKAEKFERQGHALPSTKRKIDAIEHELASIQEPVRKKGVAPIRPDFLLDSSQVTEDQSNRVNGAEGLTPSEGAGHSTDRPDKRPKNKGQNTNRCFGSSNDAIQLCVALARSSEHSPKECRYGDKCKFGHDLREYLREGKRPDLDTFGGQCPVFAARGKCEAGWRCRFASSHSEETTYLDGKKELVLIEDEQRTAHLGQKAGQDWNGITNVVSPERKVELRKRQIPLPNSESYTAWLNEITDSSGGRGDKSDKDADVISGSLSQKEGAKYRYATYREPPFLPSEKRRIYYGPETPILAPLTTQGNLPFRRLCCELGAQVTWSEMAMGAPLVQGEKNEWALLKAHQTELIPPRYNPKIPVVEGYENSKDIKFGAQIAGNKPWIALKATEVITTLCPHLRAIDLNCGCPIDLVYKQGAGSALLDTPARLEKILRGMNAVSGEVPITVKIRTGTKDSKPTAAKLVDRLAFGGPEASEMALGPAGVAAVTLHGRSRQQRYTKSADWSYISECAAVIQQYNRTVSTSVDTGSEPDPRLQSSSNNGHMYFIGSGDCYSHVDYHNHIREANVDSVMLARGALIKPWIFEEISQGQYLDKTASERLRYVEQYARYGLEAWGSDEIGVGTTRRFLLEWLSFACRYVPIGLLERLPPNMQDRPPAYRGRNDLETLMASDNYRDWIKISEMFLGPAHKDFKFEPKHKSNSYDTQSGETMPEG